MFALSYIIVITIYLCLLSLTVICVVVPMQAAVRRLTRRCLPVRHAARCRWQWLRYQRPSEPHTGRPWPWPLWCRTVWQCDPSAQTHVWLAAWCCWRQTRPDRQWQAPSAMLTSIACTHNSGTRWTWKLNTQKMSINRKPHGALTMNNCGPCHYHETEMRVLLDCWSAASGH